MKKHIFHISLSVALFCVLTVIFISGGNVGLTPYLVGKVSSESAGMLTEGEDFKCIGTPVNVTEIPESVKAGDELVVKFRGEAYTEYKIKLYFPTESGFTEEEKAVKSDGKGSFEAETHVPENVVAGSVRLSVLSEKSHLLTELRSVS